MSQLKTVALRPATRRAEPHIAGIGGYRPDRVVTNDEIARHCDSSDAWIRERTGITARRFAGAHESIAEMAAAAAKIALNRAGVDGEDVDLVLLATSTVGYQTPGVAQDLAVRIGAQTAGAADLSVGCAGFCYALGLAADAIRSGSATCALVVASERLSDFLDLRDRSTSFIFGDGAGAVVLSAAQAATVGPVAWASDGRQRDAIRQWPNWFDYRDGKGPWPTVRMDGRAVFRWATTSLTPVALRACELAGISVADIDVFVPHQANLRIVDSLVRSLGLRPGVTVARDIVDTGNTSAASVPLALSALVESGAVIGGETALCLAFGAGLSVAGQVIQVP